MSTDPQLISTPVTADLLHGALEIEETAVGVRPHRLPRWARAQADAQLAMAESQPSGVRLAFTTEATTVELRAAAVRFGYRGAPSRPAGVFDLVVDGRLSDQASLTAATPDHHRHGHRGTGDPTGRGRHDHASPACPPVRSPSRSGCRTTRTSSWSRCARTPPCGPAGPGPPALAAPRQLHQPGLQRRAAPPAPGRRSPRALAGVDLVNLGFGGSALLDPFTARTIRDTPADLISLKIGINLVNTDLMRLRAFDPAVHGFLDTIRDGHPDHTAAGRLAAPVPDPRGHPRPRRVRRARLGRGRRQVPGHRRPGRAGRAASSP